jgi:signal transduction histidine kinase
MKPVSIRLRLWSAAAISLVVALAVASVGLVYLFERHVERQLETDLIFDLNQLVQATTVADGSPVVTESGVTDPRFGARLSGHYWLVTNLGTGGQLKSRSLGDQTIDLPPPLTDGLRHFFEARGPDGTLLLVLDRTVTDDDGRELRVTVAQDHGIITQSVGSYLHELIPALLLLAAVLCAAFFAQITVGLAPLTALSAAVRSVVAGRRSRLEGAVPAEVRPLTDEINRLLDAQDKALARARARAADLAHGLKTPLQVLSADIRLLRNRGEGELADEIEKSADAIRRHVERELARSRVAPHPGSTSTEIAAVANRVADVVRRTPNGAGIDFEVAVPEKLEAPIDEGDLTEILGNLIENASRFARTRVRITGETSHDGTAITVSDDGPGIPEADREAVLHRGVSLGAVRGTGLGLAIVADIIESYRGRLTLGDAAPGLTVTVLLPPP